MRVPKVAYLRLSQDFIRPLRKSGMNFWPAPSNKSRVFCVPEIRSVPSPPGIEDGTQRDVVVASRRSAHLKMGNMVALLFRSISEAFHKFLLTYCPFYCNKTLWCHYGIRCCQRLYRNRRVGALG